MISLLKKDMHIIFSENKETQIYKRRFSFVQFAISLFLTRFNNLINSDIIVQRSV